MNRFNKHNLLAMLYGKKPDKIARINAYGSRDYEKGEDSIRLYAVVERRVLDHKLHYLFFVVKAKNYNKLIKEFVESNTSWFGTNSVVIELGEAFTTNEQVELKAARLKRDAPTAEVYVPAIILGENK